MVAVTKTEVGKTKKLLVFSAESSSCHIFISSAVPDSLYLYPTNSMQAFMQQAQAFFL